MITEAELIHAYQSLFHYRQSTNSIETIDQLEISIKVELLDELTHPRVRKSPDEKLKVAYERIDDSVINSEQKLELKQVYKKVYYSIEPS